MFVDIVGQHIKSCEINFDEIMASPKRMTFFEAHGLDRNIDKLSCFGFYDFEALFSVRGILTEC